MIRYPHEAFTHWVAVLVIASWIFPAVHDYIDVLLPATVVLVISTYIQFYDPGYFRLMVMHPADSSDEEPRIINIDSRESLPLTLGVHLATHGALFLLAVASVYSRHRFPLPRPFSAARILPAVAMIGLFPMVVRVRDVYEIRSIGTLTVLMVATILIYIASLLFWT
jgi:hypothetical protein